jgi:LAS superfamily LD-carboxypeptidase LdcB
MKRLSIVLISCILCVSFSAQKDLYSLNDLIGKGNLKLYGAGYNLQKEAHESFLLMQKEALKSGIKIKIVSSYRSYERQKSIWSRKYKQFLEEGLSPEKAILKIIEYSTIPGTSRHHWGTDIDIIDAAMQRPKSALETAHFEGDGVYVKLKAWLDDHAGEYGFCIVYTNQEGRKGFKYEPWHYSFESISKPMLAQYRKIDIQSLLKEDKLLGSKFLTDYFIDRYIKYNILDINPVLK